DAIVAQIFGCFYSLLSRMIHFYLLNPRMCQLGVRNVGLNAIKSEIPLWLRSQVLVRDFS
ncbi:hypothetical protein NDA07_11275, partial [Microcoleus vaginatus DQ-U2]|uniref:hypothetical protein n=1 Tax=Microcoleus vaginatus TaxID=119532 RepID=UPI001A7E6DAB